LDIPYRVFFTGTFNVNLDVMAIIVWNLLLGVLRFSKNGKHKKEYLIWIEKITKFN